MDRGLRLEIWAALCSSLSFCGRFSARAFDTICFLLSSHIKRTGTPLWWNPRYDWNNDALFQQAVGIEVVVLDVEEIFVSAHFQFGRSCVVAYDDALGVHLQSRDGPHLRNATLYTLLQSTGFVVAVYNDEHVASRHDGTHTYRQRRFGHEVGITAKETRVGDDGVLCERFYTSARGERRARLVEGDVTVGSYATEEELDTSVGSDFSLVTGTLLFGIGSITIEDIYVFGTDVDVREEIAPHESVVALFVIFGQIAIFVHVESHYVAERNDTFLVELDEVFIHTQRRRTGGKTQHERLLFGRIELIDARCHIVCGPTRNSIIGWFDNYSHDFIDF